MGVCVCMYVCMLIQNAFVLYIWLIVRLLYWVKMRIVTNL